MTNEERQKLVNDLLLISNDDIEGESWIGLKCREAAEEIKRLQAENNWLRTALRAAKMERESDKIERLQRELNMTLGLLYQESERRAKAEHDLKRWQEVGWSRVKATPSSRS